MRFDVVTLFPEMFDALACGVVGRAIDRGLLELVTWNPRDYTSDAHRTVDDRPYGGGPGMVMLAEPLRRSLRDARAATPSSRVAYLSPQGRRFDQAAARELAAGGRNWILLAGRYEGVDERIIAADVDAEWSVGDYVLSGGELPAMAVIDAVTRLLPGALGHADSAAQDSFSDGLLDCPHFTRPEVFEGRAVPSVLLSGDHAAIRRWRLQQALGRTWTRRPDLLLDRPMSIEEHNLLAEYLRASGHDQE